MQLHCPHCSHHIEEDGINVVKTIAVCKSCSNIFDFTNQLDAATLPVPYRKITHIPKGIDLTEYTDSMEIRVKWRDAGGCFLLGFGIFWTGFVAFWTSMVLFMGGPIPMALFSIPFWIIGVLMLYTAITNLITKTSIHVDAEYLALEHEPLRPLGQKNHYYHPEEVEQLYVKQHVTHSKKGGRRETYRVHLQLRSKRDVELIRDLPKASAQYIEQRIEAYLGIANRPVRGEYGGK